MSTYGVYDYDFFHYKMVIPNLECAKLIAYFRNNNHFSILTPNYNKDAPYTQYYVRKDYDDGIYPTEFFTTSCVYGGRAFTENYKPLEIRAEHTIPNMHIYENYETNFGDSITDRKFFHRLLNCAHIRLSLDGKTVDDERYLWPNLTGTNGIIFHDYDISNVEGAREMLKKLSESRYFVGEPDKLNPLPIGNKFPIRINSPKEFSEWCELTFLTGALSFEYDGLMNNNFLLDITNLQNSRLKAQLTYDPTVGCANPHEFFVQRAPEILKQVLFFRKHQQKILLKYRDKFFETREQENFMILLNCFARWKWMNGFLPCTQTLYRFARNPGLWSYQNYWHKIFTLNVQEIRDVFYYMQAKYYDLFKMFYEWDSVLLEGGELINEWDRSK